MAEAVWLLGSILWLAGLALLLALVSYRDAGANATRPAPPDLGGIAWDSWVLAGQMLVCVGFLLASRTWLERLGWGLLALLVVWRARQAKRGAA